MMNVFILFIFLTIAISRLILQHNFVSSSKTNLAFNIFHVATFVVQLDLLPLTE